MFPIGYNVNGIINKNSRSGRITDLTEQFSRSGVVLCITQFVENDFFGLLPDAVHPSKNQKVLIFLMPVLFAGQPCPVHGEREEEAYIHRMTAGQTATEAILQSCHRIEKARDSFVFGISSFSGTVMPCLACSADRSCFLIRFSVICAPAPTCYSHPSGNAWHRSCR